jgi:ArsR family transcriptional regulator, arsenate/arsenite/antimonite-responsive transcriptional repressor
MNSRRRAAAEERAKVFKALSDPTRVDIVDALAKHGPMCGTELANALGISLALLSHHWDVLVEAGLIRKKRVGQLRFCTLDPAKLHEATRAWDDAVLEPVAPTAPAPAKKKRAARKTPATAR